MTSPEKPARLVLGSRRSRLARVQAERVGALLRARWSGLRVEHVYLLTEGDRVLDRPIPELGGKGLFTAELEASIRTGSIDAAVHSLKDLPTRSDPGLAILAVPEREDPRDVLVSADGRGIDELPEGAVVGTSSLRRRAQLLRRRPDCVPRPVRGNVDTRLRKLRGGEFDALILAAAGLRRLGAPSAPARPLDPDEWLPAPGQGTLAVQGRSDDDTTRTLLVGVEDPAVRASTSAERAFLERLEGSCHVPVGALASLENGRLRLRGIVLSPDGREAVSSTIEGAPGRASWLGRALAEELLASGAERILAPLRESTRQEGRA